jgi:hypothetical protein
MDTTKELTEHIADREMNTAAELTTPGTARKLISTANITVDLKRGSSRRVAAEGNHLRRW